MNQPGWTTLEPDVAAFLDEYDAHGRSADENAATLFADSFLVLDPVRAATVTPAALAAALPARRRMFDNAGVGEFSRTDARQLRLDDRHVLVTADWSAERAGATPLPLTSTFLLRREGSDYRVVVYLNHTDLAAALGRTTGTQA